MATNHVIIEGTLTRDPEVRSTNSGKTVLKFSIAHNTRKKDEATGQYVDGEASFFDIEQWPNDPAYWIKRLGKGVTVLVEGSLKQDRWTGEDGTVRSRIILRADNITGKWLPEISTNAAASSAAPARAPSDAPATGSAPDDDTPPF